MYGIYWKSLDLFLTDVETGMVISFNTKEKAQKQADILNKSCCGRVGYVVKKINTDDE